MSGGKVVDVGDTRRIVEAYSQSCRKMGALSERHDRSGTGLANIEFIVLGDGKAEPTFRIGSMEPLSFRVTVSAAPDVVGKKLDVILIACDGRDIRMVPLYTEWTRSDLQLTSERQSFRCSVPEGLPLIADTYWLTAAVLVGGINADKLDRALEFQIAPSEKFASGLVLNPAFGQVLVQHVWEEDHD